jgi:signal transduction histidine kinase
MVGWSRLGKIMSIPLKDRSWTSFVWASLAMWLMVVCVLIFARTQLHEEVIASDSRFLKSIFEKNLEEFYLQNLESEFLFTDNELSTYDFIGLETLLNQAAITCLNIPQIQGIEAYNQKFEAFDLSTSISNAYPSLKEFEEAFSNGWSYRSIKSNTLSLLTPIHNEGVEICVEFILLPNSYEKSWKEIDAALIRQGFLIGLTMLVILWVIFKIMIGRISAKEKLLLERTEVLKKTNEELSRAYKTAGLGAMTGHLMHGLRGQLTNLQNLVTEDKNAHQQISQIQQLVQQSLGSIQEVHDGQIAYSLTIGELFVIVKKQFSQTAPTAKFDVVSKESLSETLNNLQSNLALAILTNLIQNAIDARSGVSISLSCRKSDSYIEIDISDNGSGIPPFVKNCLFEPVVSKKGGSGIGLALSQQLAESMEAKLILNHSDQAGTSFRLSIPYHS